MPQISTTKNITAGKQTVYECVNRLDAFYLKNAIERVSCISVEIIKKANFYKISVNTSNQRKAIIIIENNIYNLPSKKAMHS